MSKDIRVSLDFKIHRKRKKLFRVLGAGGVLALIDLWSSVAEQRPTGILSGYDQSDIEIDAGWIGEAGLFVETILDIGFLDIDDLGVYSMHNWEDRQGWVFNSKERGDKARFSRLAKVSNAEYLKLKEAGIRAISKERYREIAGLKINETLTERQGIVKEAVTPSPEPAPFPSPTHNVLTQNQPDKSGNLSVVSSKNRSDGFRNSFNRIKLSCNVIENKEPIGKLRKLKPYQWVQVQINKSMHPGAIDECLRVLIKDWNKIAKGYYGFLNKLISVKSPTYWESEEAQTCENFKKDLLDLAGQTDIFTKLGINIKELNKL